MTKYDAELLELVRGSDDPTQALVTAIDIISAILTQHESSQ